MNPNYPNAPQASFRPRSELLEFAKAWLGTALAFAILFSGPDRTNPQYYTSGDFVLILLMAALTAGLGVVLHELMHRVVARAFGATAHFIANNGMLVVSIVLAFTGFLIAAPGAVWHTGRLTPRQVGLIAAAGPITNMVLALLAVLLLIVGGSVASPIVLFGLHMAFYVNAILGIFNMLPFGLFDGAKVVAWSGAAFGVLIAAAAFVAFGVPTLLPWLSLQRPFF